MGIILERIMMHCSCFSVHTHRIHGLERQALAFKKLLMYLVQLHDESCGLWFQYSRKKKPVSIMTDKPGDFCCFHC